MAKILFVVNKVEYFISSPRFSTCLSGGWAQCHSGYTNFNGACLLKDDQITHVSFPLTRSESGSIKS